MGDCVPDKKNAKPQARIDAGPLGGNAKGHTKAAQSQRQKNLPGQEVSIISRRSAGSLAKGRVLLKIPVHKVVH